MGFLGCVALIALYGCLVPWLAYMSLRCASPFCRLLIGGAAMTIFLFVFVNICMVTGVLPVVGVPLPLMSYGGTSMFATQTLLGLALAVYANRRQRLEPPQLL